MSIQAYTHDSARPSTITPTFDIAGARIFAYVYDQKTGDYKGRVNTISPYASFPEVSVDIISSQGTGDLSPEQTLLIEVLTIEDGVWNTLEILEVKTTIEAGSTSNRTFPFDPQDRTDFKVGTITIKEIDPVDNYTFDNEQIIDPVLSTAEGVAIAGAVDEPIAVHCNYTNLKPGVYSIVFVASEDIDITASTGSGFQGSGLIGKDILILFGNDGFSTE